MLSVCASRSLVWPEPTSCVRSVMISGAMSLPTSGRAGASVSAMSSLLIPAACGTIRTACARHSILTWNTPTGGSNFRKSALPLHLAEKHTALALGGRFGFDDRHNHSVGRGIEVFHHGIGDILDQRLFLFLSPALDGMDVDFGHLVLPCSLSSRIHYNELQRDVAKGNEPPSTSRANSYSSPLVLPGMRRRRVLAGRNARRSRNDCNQRPVPWWGGRRGTPRHPVRRQEFLSSENDRIPLWCDWRDFSWD